MKAKQSFVSFISVGAYLWYHSFSASVPFLPSPNTNGNWPAAAIGKRPG